LQSRLPSIGLASILGKGKPAATELANDDRHIGAGGVSKTGRTSRLVNASIDRLADEHPGNRKEDAMTRRTTQHEDGPGRTSRRGMLKTTAGAAVLGAAALGSKLQAQDSPSSERAVKNGRINQSIVYWCFEKYWDMDQACKVAKQLGCESIELMSPKYFAKVQSN
jgi:hypothetical protein